MDRYEARDNRTIEELIASAERGNAVELTRDGRVVARVVAEAEPALEPSAGDWRKALDDLHAKLPPEVFEIDWQATLRDVREGRFG